MNRQIQAAIVVAALLSAGAATAADLPSRQAPPVAPVAYAPPAFTWTGFYVGANVGGAWGSVKGARGVGFRDTNSFVGGGQVGYNYQIGQAVLGVEADFQGTDLSSRVSNVFGDSASTQVKWFGTVRGRVGYAFDRFMPYVTGGLAYGNVRSAFYFPRFGSSYGKDDVRAGYTVGVGGEYAFTNNLTARLEYLYVDLKGAEIPGLGVKVGAETSVVRAAVNYKF